MANFLGRVDSRMFMKLFVFFNVVLAIYNFLSFRVSPIDNNVPCKGIQESLNNKMIHLNEIDLAVKEGPEVNTAVGSFNNIRVVKRGKYLVLPNFVQANRTYHGNESVTLSTQSSNAFLQHSENLCRSWGGPLSISVYLASGGHEISRAMQIIGHLRLCGHPCVFENVSWHFILEADATWPVLDPKEASVVIKPDFEPPQLPDLSITNYNCTSNDKALFHSKKALHTEGEQRLPGRGYPINVLRNVARSLATTFYVLASDIELYTSTNIIPRFLKMVSLESKDDKAIKENQGPHVYVLPIFEVHKDESPPETKSVMVELLKKNRAVYFHKWTCDACQNFPGRNTWASVLPNNSVLGIHEKSMRDRNRGSWEPIYIGTNADPFYEEELTWEGKRDKMSQMFEMCMMGYNTYILDNAFLVHAPGIKTINATDEHRRAPFMAKNNAVYQRTITRIRKKYSNKKRPC